MVLRDLTGGSARLKRLDPRLHVRKESMTWSEVEKKVSDFSLVVWPSDFV